MPNSSVGSEAPLPSALMWPDSSRRSLVLTNLHKLLDSSPALDWQVLYPGVNIHWLYRDGDQGSAAAFIRFDPGGRVPLHEHRGFEHIFVLEGSQTDENGRLPTGGLMVHAPGTRHSIVSEEGCLVLAIYEKRALFLAPPPP
jgi:anti-sigma factor ChrR (cupin superfamily)